VASGPAAGSTDAPRGGSGVRCAVCGVRCAVCGVRCAVCGVRCAVCGVRIESARPCPAKPDSETLTGAMLRSRLSSRLGRRSSRCLCLNRIPQRAYRRPSCRLRKLPCAAMPRTEATMRHFAPVRKLHQSWLFLALLLTYRQYHRAIVGIPRFWFDVCVRNQCDWPRAKATSNHPR